MKIKLLIIYMCIMFFSCKKGENHDRLKGSWFSVNKQEKTYEEIHVDDSLFIYCYDNCNVLLTFSYSIKDDSIYLSLDKMSVESKYQMLFNKINKEEMVLINKQKRLDFKKMDETYKNLNDFLIDYESMDSLSNDYFERRNIILSSLNDTIASTR